MLIFLSISKVLQKPDEMQLMLKGNCTMEWQQNDTFGNFYLIMSLYHSIVYIFLNTLLHFISIYLLVIYR